MVKWVHGLTRDDVYGEEFFTSSDFKLIRSFAIQLDGLLENNAFTFGQLRAVGGVDGRGGVEQQRGGVERGPTR